MFSPFSIFILLASILIGLSCTIFNPLNKVSAYMRGKTGKQLGEAFDKAVYVYEDGVKVMDDDDTPKINWSNIVSKGSSCCLSGCCFLGILLPLDYLVTYVVEPIFILTAITKGIGNVYLAYAMLVIILISAFLAIRGLVLGAKEISKATKAEKAPEPKFANDEERIAYKVRQDMEKEQEEKKVSLTNSQYFLDILRRIFFALPDLYLIYLVVLALWPKM